MTRFEMTSKSAKQNKKDSTPPDAATANEFSMAALTSLLDRHKADLAAEFKTAFTVHGQRIASLETNADSVDGCLLGLEATCAELTAANEKLKAKTADLEGRSRRNNVRIIGLPESIEGPRPTQLLGEETLPKPPVLDRAHRSLAPKPKQGERPRPVIIRFHDYQTKERVLREARKRRSDLRYLESPVAIFEDFSPEVMAQRAKAIVSGRYSLLYSYKDWFLCMFPPPFFSFFPPPPLSPWAQQNDSRTRQCR
uniref:Transposase element L1Md-A101/L1Md-A102/L1Md-A2 n=1 Tax=Takifugu rubripes TaxID=31033 RepID=A0A674P7S6_TAKRU